MITLKFTLQSGREIELTDSELREVLNAYNSLSRQAISVPFVQQVTPLWQYTKTSTATGANAVCSRIGCNQPAGHYGACDPVVSFGSSTPPLSN